MNIYECTFLGINVIAQHQLLQGAIGTFPEEDEAYWRVTTLMWALPLTVILATLLDFFLIFVYMKYAHPWKGILSNKEEKEAKKKAKKEAKKIKKNQKTSKYSFRRHIPDDFI